MSDLISRADAIDVVMRHKISFSIQQEVAREIDALPSADAEWIPCSERLPKMREVTHYGETYRVSECVLVTGTLEYQEFDTYNTSIFVGNCFDDMNGTDIYWYQNEDRIINVTAWMPLPMPYREDGE